MESKYYIPKKEELHVSFEYEKAVVDNNWTITDWKPSKVETFTDLNRIEEYPQYYRVKFLDEKDLEELGFIKDPHYDCYSTNGENVLSLNYFEEDKGRYLSYDESENQFSFGGWVKNKSEMRKLMKMLNIV